MLIAGSLPLMWSEREQMNQVLPAFRIYSLLNQFIRIELPVDKNLIESIV